MTKYTAKERALRWLESIQHKLETRQKLTQFEHDLLVQFLTYSITNDRKIGPAFTETLERMESYTKLTSYDTEFLVPYLNSAVEYARSNSQQS